MLNLLFLMNKFLFDYLKNHIYNHISNARNKNTWKFSIAKYVYRVRSGVETASKIFSLKAKFQTRLVTLPIKFLEIPKFIKSRFLVRS